MMQKIRQHRRQKARRLGRPCSRRLIHGRINSYYFKPQGIAMNDLDIIEITAEEAEALRLKNIEELDQIECAKKMKTSQSTFQRILTSAYKKTSKAIINGNAIKILKK